MNSKKAVLWLGSPRKNGNSTILGNRIAEGFSEAGGEAAVYDLPGMNVQPCTGCEYCKTGKDRYCKIEDDMEALFPVLEEAGALILASPIYWFHISAQLKAAVDRWYAMIGRTDGRGANLLAGKKIALAFSYGGDDPISSGAVNAYRSFQDACLHIDACITGAVYCKADKPGEVEDQAAILSAASELGKRLYTPA